MESRTTPLDTDPGPAEHPLVREPSRAGPKPSEVIRNLDSLEKSPVLYTLTDAQLRRLARRLRLIELGPGATVIQEDQVGDSLYLIRQGSCRVTVRVGPDRRVTVAQLGEGDLFGETALVGEPSAVSVATTSEAQLLALDGAALRSVVPVGSPEEAEVRPLILRRHAAYREQAARARRVVDARDAAVTAVYAAKGGSGRTTIALNLAAQLARDDPGSVLLVDLDFPYNQAALLCGVIPDGSLTTASWRTSMGTDSDLEDALLGASKLHPAGFMVLPGTVRVEESELIDPDHVTRALGVLRGSFKYIVADLGIALSETALRVFDAAQYAVVVVAPELPSLKGVRDALRVFHEVMHFPHEGVKVVLNQRQPSAAVSPQAVERALGRRPDVLIGYDGKHSQEAVLAGTVAAVSAPRSEMARGTRTLADLLLAATPARRQPQPAVGGQAR